MSEEITQPSFGARDKDMAPGEGRPKGRRRRKVSYLTIQKIHHVDYKEIAILRRFINDRGKMLPARQTGNTAKQQRMIARAIRRARELALLPFVVTEITADQRGPGFRRERRPRDFDRNNDRGGDRYESRNDSRNEAPKVEAPAAAPAPEATETATAE